MQGDLEGGMEVQLILAVLFVLALLVLLGLWLQRASGRGSGKLAGQRTAGQDDLTRIKGIGPVIARKLHAMGIDSYAQIAAFSAEDVARVDAVLDFKGRIEREGWIRQARQLAAEKR